MLGQQPTPKKRSLFASRHRPASTPHLPPIELISVPVANHTITERTGAINLPIPIDTAQFPLQPLGFPVASLNSLAEHSNAPPADPPPGNHLLVPSPMLTQEQLSIHRASSQLIQQYDHRQIEEAHDHFKSTLRPDIVSMLLHRAAEKYDSHDSSSPAPVPLPEDTVCIPKPTDPNEHRKLEWTTDITPRQDEPAHSANEDPNDPLTQDMALPGASLRFDLTGILVTSDTHVPMHLGLHHHSRNPSVPGYSIPELVHLLRSRFSAQRLIAVKVIGEIIALLWQPGAYQDHHHVILACLHACNAIIQVRGLVLDANASVGLHALIALYELVKPGIHAVRLNMWDGVHMVVSSPVLLQNDLDNDSIANQVRNLNSNIPGALLAMDLVADLCLLLNTPTLCRLSLSILGILCIQMQRACKQIIDTHLDLVLSAIFKSLDEFVGTAATETEIETVSVIIQLLRMLVLYDPNLVNPSLKSELGTPLLKLMSIPPDLVHLKTVVTATMQLTFTLINYGISIYVPETLQLLYNQYLECPGTYAIARAVKSHLPEIAILTVPIVDHAYLYLQSNLTSDHLVIHDYELLVETARLVASRNVPPPIADMPSVIDALVNIILAQLPRVTDCEGDVLDFLVHPDTHTNSFKVFPYNAGRLIHMTCNRDLQQPINLLELIIRHQLPNSSVLAIIRTCLIEPVLRQGRLIQVAMLVPILVTYTTHLHQLVDPVDHLVAYYAITFMNVPREHQLHRLMDHLQSISQVWSLILQTVQCSLVDRKTLYVSLPITPIDRIGVYPRTINARTWLGTDIRALHAVMQWHVQSSALGLPWLTCTDLARIFMDEDLPYLTYATELADICLHVGGGVADLALFENVVDAFCNMSYFAPVFQIYLIRVLFSEGTTDDIRILFFSHMFEAGTLSRLALDKIDGDLAKLAGRTDQPRRELLRLFTVALQYLPVASVWYRIVSIQLC